MADVISISFSNGKKQDYQLDGAVQKFADLASLSAATLSDGFYIVTLMDSAGKTTMTGMLRYSPSRGGFQEVVDGVAKSDIVKAADVFAGFADTFKDKGSMSLQKVVEVAAPTTTDPAAQIAALIAEADGYAAQMVKLGVGKQADYDAAKAAAMGRGWTPESAKAFRDSTKAALDKAKASEATKAPIGLIIGGVILAIFLLSRKKGE
jgi:hypothetical protein